MNHQQTIQELTKRSGEAAATCELVMKGYEKYTQKHIKEAGRNNLEEIAFAIAQETGLEIRICQNILTQFFDLLAERTAKLPFMNTRGGNTMKKIIIAMIVVIGLGTVSQVVESSMDKAAVKDFVTTNLKTPADEQYSNVEENGGK